MYWTLQVCAYVCKGRGIGFQSWSDGFVNRKIKKQKIKLKNPIKTITDQYRYGFMKVR